MIKDETNSAIFIVLIAGIFWSFGPLVVRYIEDAKSIPWQYAFFRGVAVFLVLNIYLFLVEGKNFLNNYKRIGISGLIGGVGLGTCNITFVLSITHTSAAVTLLMIAAMPFMAAILGYFFLKEKISRTTLIAIVIAASGIIYMAFDSNKIGTLFGLVNGLLSALGFAIFSVSLRWKKGTPKFTTVAVAGLVGGGLSLCVLIFNDSNIFITFRSSSLSALHGLLVCIGFIMFSIKSKYLPVADLTLLSLTEVVGGIFWVWLPFLGINEIPSPNTFIGGLVITFAIIYYSVNVKRNRALLG